VTTASTIETTGAIAATAAAGIAAVWLTGDPRAFGAVVALAGLAVGVAIGFQEWRASRPASGAGASHESGHADITRAA
jgi:hypothetical protein